MERTLVGARERWIGLHRGLGGEHRALGELRHQLPWKRLLGLAVMVSASVASMWLLLGTTPPARNPSGPVVLPGICSGCFPASYPPATTPYLEPAATVPTSRSTAKVKGAATSGPPRQPLPAAGVGAKHTKKPSPMPTCSVTWKPHKK